MASLPVTLPGENFRTTEVTIKVPQNKSGHFLLFAGCCFNVAAYYSINQSNNGVLLLEAAAAEFSLAACFS